MATNESTIATVSSFLAQIPAHIERRLILSSMSTVSTISPRMTSYRGLGRRSTENGNVERNLLRHLKVSEWNSHPASHEAAGIVIATRAAALHLALDKDPS